MKRTYRVVAGLIAFGVLVQAAAVAHGWFQVLGGLQDGAGAALEGDDWFGPGHVVHLFVGLYAMPVLGLVLLLVALLEGGSVRGARTWGGIVFVLIVLQVALAVLAVTSTPALGALHGANALLVLGAALRAAFLTDRTGAPDARTGQADERPAARVA